jgi:chemotaxis protein CheD
MIATPLITNQLVPEKLYPVPIGEMMVSADPADVLVVYGVGSCVVVCLHDPVTQVGGLLHALLPGAAWNRRAVSGKPTKFVDQGVPLLLKSLIDLGAKPARLQAHLCGGASMITTAGFNDMMNIGERNVLAAQMALQAAGLKINAQATGGQNGRTVKLRIANGQVTLKMLGEEEKMLTNHHRRSNY